VFALVYAAIVLMLMWRARTVLAIWLTGAL
jgi:hypothetical protein